MNARFWTYINGDVVKLTLKPGQSFSWFTSGLTDEGSRSEGRTWSYDGWTVTRTYGSSETDCDGRVTSCGEDVSTFAELRDGNHALLNIYSLREHATIIYPKWRKMASSQRDFSAEAMGY